MAALLGLGELSLTHFLDDSIKLKSGNIVMLGLRDIDPPEAEILKEHIFVIINGIILWNTVFRTV